MVHFSQKEKFFPHVIGKDFIADLKCGFLNMIISGLGRKVRKLSFIICRELFQPNCTYVIAK